MSEVQRFLLHGGGVEARAAAGYFAGRGGCDVVFTDDGDGTIEGLAKVPPAEARQRLPGSIYLRSPGVPPTNPLVQEAARTAALATTPTGFWLSRHAPEGTITVTGTKGKSTTTSLLSALLTEAGLTSAAYGNIGAPPLAATLPQEAHPVVEVSSYMMHDLPEADHLHLLTNLYKDHVHWHGTVDAYHRAKLRPFLRDVPASGAAPAPVIERYGLPAAVRAIEDLVPERDGHLLVGGRTADLGPDERGFAEGPQRLAMRAALAAALLVADADRLRSAAEAVAASFQGLPSRQFIVPTTDGRIWVDDALATVPEASLAVLRRFAGRPCVLLLGGGDRGQEFGDLEAYAAARRDLTVIAFGPAGARFTQADERTDGLEAAIDRANAICPREGAILFSPAAPSSPPYANYQERSAVFAAKAAAAT